MNRRKSSEEIMSVKMIGFAIFGVGVILFLICSYWAYSIFRINVPQGHIAVLMKKTGIDLESNQVFAPDDKHKGIQLNVLSEGRYLYNPWNWSWSVYPMIEIPKDKMGVRTRLYGKNLPYAHFLAKKEEEKGIVEEVLKPGRYPFNAIIKGEATRIKKDYAEIIELFDPISITAGFRGIVTNLAGPVPENPNTILSEKGFRGVYEETLDAGTYYLNPYMFRINMIDCRSQRFNLANETQDMGFPSKDGFWVSLDGIIEFRVKPEKAAEVYVLYNEPQNDTKDKDDISNEIIKKIITPNARSFCRLKGSNSTGREFIGGETRTTFQKDFSTAMQNACENNGIEILQALITKINPPQAIAEPVRNREIANQKKSQFVEQVLQQKEEAKLAIEQALIKQREDLVVADQQVNEIVTKSLQDQEVAVTKANENNSVAKRDLDAAKDQALAILSLKKAEASIINFSNEAEAAGWKKSVEALGDGNSFANYVMLQKLAPAYKQIMTNSADSPLMEIFKNFNNNKNQVKQKEAK